MVTKLVFVAKFQNSERAADGSFRFAESSRVSQEGRHARYGEYTPRRTDEGGAGILKLQQEREFCNRLYILNQIITSFTML